MDHLSADLGRRTVSGGVIAVTAQIIKTGLQFVTLAVMARLLLPGDFGLVAMATTVTVFVGLFTDLGLSAATVQRKEISQTVVSALFYVNVGMGLLIMAVTVALAPVAAGQFGDPRVAGVVTVLALQIPFVAATAQHAALLRRGMRWVTIHAIGATAQLAGAAIGIGLAWTTEIGYWALIAQSWAAVLTEMVLVWIYSRWRPGKAGNWQEVRAAVKFGMNLTGFSFINYFHRQFDDVLIGRRWGAAELGYYSRAYQLLLMPIALINNPVGSAVIPALSRLQSDPQRWSRTYLDALGAVMLISSGLTAALIATAEPLVAVVFGDGWQPAADIFALLAVSMFAAAPMNTVGWVYISLGRTDRMFRWALMSTPFLVVSFLVGLPYGAKGVALAYSCGVCLLMFPGILFAFRGTPLRASDVMRVILPPIAAGVTSGAFGHFLLGGLLAGWQPLGKLFLGVSGVVLIYATLAILIVYSNSAFDSFKRRLTRLNPKRSVPGGFV